MRVYFESTIRSHDLGENKFEVGTFEVLTFRDRNVFNVFIQDTSNHHQTELHFVIDGHVHALVGEKGYYQSTFLLHEVIEKKYQILLTDLAPNWQIEPKRLPEWNQIEELAYENAIENGVQQEPELEVLRYFKSENDFGLFFQLKEGVEEAKFCIKILVYPENHGCGFVKIIDVELKANSMEHKFYYLQTNCEDNIYRVLKNYC